MTDSSATATTARPSGSLPINVEYSFCTEDTHPELEALAVTGKRAVAIAESGGRAFGLLVDDPKEVVAVDINPEQIRLCQLYTSAMRKFERSDYLRLLGLAPSEDRVELYNVVRPELPLGTARYWDGRLEAIRKGVIYAGHTQRSLIEASRATNPILGWYVNRVDRIEDPARRHRTFTRPGLARACVRGLIARLSAAVAGGGIITFTGRSSEAFRQYVEERTLAHLARHKISDSLLLQLALRGELKAPASVPLYLEPQNYEVVRSRLDRVSFVISDLEGYLRACRPQAFDAFSLSDVVNYLPLEQTASMLKEVVRVARPGARVCLRSYLVREDDKITASWPAELERLPDVDAACLQMDTSLVYGFTCGRRRSP